MHVKKKPPDRKKNGPISFLFALDGTILANTNTHEIDVAPEFLR